MGRLPELAWDPADMPALRRKLAAMPEAHAFQDFELARVEIGPEAIRSLPAVRAARPRQGRAGRLLSVRGGDAPAGAGDLRPGRPVWEDGRRMLERLPAQAGGLAP